MMNMVDSQLIYIIGAIVAYTLTMLCMNIFRERLPHDQGRIFAVEGTLSKGKVRGAGIVFILVLVIIDILCNEFSSEHITYMVAIVFTMITGFMDDASSKPWNEYVKGALDLLLAIIVAITYLHYNGNSFSIGLLGGMEVTLPVWLYGILIIALVWTSINVTNCSDGVDGLSGTLSIITIGSFYLLAERLGRLNDFNYTEVLVIVVVLAYLWYNANPSTMLMGDAGSRSLVMIIAIASLKSGSPLLYIPFALVMLLDGGLGLIKVALLRFLKIKILVKIRCPLHDHARKNMGWSNTQVDYRFAILQLTVSIITAWLYIYLSTIH